MKVRSFNDAGIDKMKEFLFSLTSAMPLAYPAEILESDEYTELLCPEIEVDLPSCSNRFQLGQHLYSMFGGAEITDKGVWAWLSLKCFSNLCPAGKNGKRAPGAMARWIPERDFRTYYRHLLAGPYNIYKAHADNPDRALVLLCNTPDKPGDIAEQLASRQEIVTNISIIGAATRLYIDPKTSKFRRGAAGRGPGSARRLADVLNQFDLTWDLYAMDEDKVFEMLPSEFNRFKGRK